MRMSDWSSDVCSSDLLLTARKHTGLLTVAEEDLNDSAADIIEAKEIDWATSYGKYFDNATLATSAAETALTVPYISVRSEERRVGDEGVRASRSRESRCPRNKNN